MNAFGPLPRPAACMVAFALLALVACAPARSTDASIPAGSGGGEEHETLDPTAFDDPTTIDNRWLPLVPGTEYLFEGTTFEEGELSRHWLEFTVTDLVKEIGGVSTVVTWILDYSDGELVEKEISFYAQDNEGNVWYLGEHPEEYEDGNFISAPTWIHGITDGRAGIMMTAVAEPGSPSYSQGWSPAVDFQDRGQVVDVLKEMCTAIDCYEAVVVVQEFTAAEPGAAQLKYYAPGVGNVRVNWEGADAQREELELIGINRLSSDELAEIRAQALELEAHAYEISPDVYGQTEPMRMAAP